jgi:hypothetical protein
VVKKIRATGLTEWWEWARILISYVVDRASVTPLEQIPGNKHVFVPVTDENVQTLRDDLVLLGRDHEVHLILSKNVPQAFVSWAQANLPRVSMYYSASPNLYEAHGTHLVVDARVLETDLAALITDKIALEDAVLLLPGDVAFDTANWKEPGALLSRMEIRLINDLMSVAVPMKGLLEVNYYARLFARFA